MKLPIFRLYRLVLLILFASMIAFAAAPPAAGAGSSSARAKQASLEEQLENWWQVLQDDRIRDALVHNLIQNYLTKPAHASRPSIEELKAHFKTAQGTAWTPIIKLVHREMLIKDPIILEPNVQYVDGNFDSYSKKLLRTMQNTLQSELHGKKDCYVRVILNTINLGSMRPELLAQLIQELHKRINTMHCHLLSLDLNGNFLTNLHPRIFEGMSELQELDLCKNRLKVLDQRVFQDLQNLEELNLSYNQLTVLPPGIFDSMHNLEWLYLTNNKLTTLTPQVFNGLQHLQALLLSDNPFVSGTVAIQELRRQLPFCTIR